MKIFNKPLSLAVTSLMLGFAASAVARDRSFGYLHAVGGQNQVSILNRCFSGGIPIAGVPCTVAWSTLSHGALQQQPNWAVFVTPTLGITGVGDTVIGPTPDGDIKGAFDFRINYDSSAGKYRISRTQVNDYPGDPGTHYEVVGAYGVGVMENTASSIISLTNVAPTVDTYSNRPKYIIDHPLLNNHPESIPVLSVKGTSAAFIVGATNFLCSSLGYDETRQKWYITSLCAYNLGTIISPNYRWTAVDLYIKVSQPDIQGIKHTVTVSNRLTPCRAMAECSLIDDPLVNSRPDAVLVVSRGNPITTSQDLVGARYNVDEKRWQLECIPYQDYDLGPEITACHLNNNAQYHIWVPTAVSGKDTMTTTFIPSSSLSYDYPISNSGLATSVSPSMQQMIASELGTVNNTQTTLNYDPGPSTWILGALNLTPFAADSSYAVHTFASRQNAYLHKTSTTDASYYSRIDHPLLNGRDSFFVVQSVQNPFGLPATVLTTNQNVGLSWDSTALAWTISLENPGATFGAGSYYNVLMPERFQSAGEADASAHPRGFRHISDSSNTFGSCTSLTNPDWAFNSNVRLFVNHVIKDPSSPFPSYLNAPISTSYPFLAWQICRNDGLAMPLDEKFNVIAYPNINDRIFANSYE